MRIYLLLLLVPVIGLGCAQMKYSGRYQEVKIDSEPTGAKVLVEGSIGLLSPVAVKAEDGTELAYSSPMQLQTPVTVILDKENTDYRVKIAYEGYPEYELDIKTRFAFHPYLIITFPVVPFFSNYEIQRFDDVFVDFNALKYELEAKRIQQAKTELDEAKMLFAQKLTEIDNLTVELEEKQKTLAGTQKELSLLKEELRVAEEACESAGDDKLEELEVMRDDLKNKLVNAEAASQKIAESVEKMQERLRMLNKETSVAGETLENLQVRYDELKKVDNSRDPEEKKENSEEK